MEGSCRGLIKELLGNSSGGIEEELEIFQNSRLPGRDLNPGASQFE